MALWPEVVSMEEFETAVVQGCQSAMAAGPRTSYAEMKRLMWESEFKDFESLCDRRGQVPGHLQALRTSRRACAPLWRKSAAPAMAKHPSRLEVVLL